MYTKEQKERALKEFERLGSVQAVVTLLGYPSRHTLYNWYRNKIADIADYHGSLDKEYQIKQKYINAPNHPRNPDTNLKLDAIKRCFSLGEGVEYVSRDIGYSRASIYSEKGCSPDNAACEGFFGRLKNEMFYGRSWVGVPMDDFINEINSYIEWYNTKRIKQSLGYMSPVEYRHSLGLTA